MAGREFTLTELAEYDGKDGKPVYLAIRGQVFDVSEGRSFYGAGGPYQVFAGKECARALALMKIDGADCNDDLSGLEDKHLTVLQDWVKKFIQKYPVVGRVSGCLGAGAGPAPPATAAGSLGKTAVGIALACAVIASVCFTYTSVRAQ